MPRTVALTKSAARPTIAQAYALAKRLTASQQARLVARLRRAVWADVQAVAEQTETQMETDGAYMSEAEITAEVEAVRAERYAASFR